jgi:hypothetical protein
VFKPSKPAPSRLSLFTFHQSLMIKTPVFWVRKSSSYLQLRPFRFPTFILYYLNEMKSGFDFGIIVVDLSAIALSST